MRRVYRYLQIRRNCERLVFMATETDVLLRKILFDIKRAKTLSEAVHGIRVMCPKDIIDAVEQELKEFEAEECETVNKQGQPYT